MGEGNHYRCMDCDGSGQIRVSDVTIYEKVSPTRTIRYKAERGRICPRCNGTGYCDNWKQGRYH